MLTSRFMAKLDFRKHLTLVFLLLCSPLHASFIEQTMGTAVVKDATAVYFNPAALTMSPHQQFILLGTLAKAQFEFNGRAQTLTSGSSESGATASKSNFILPSMYLSTPINKQFVAGFAVVANDFNRELDNHPILRYILARNQTNNMDLIPAIGIKINQFISIGGNLSFTYAHLLQEPIAEGIARLNIPESHSLNDSQANSLGGDFGILIKPGNKTALGFNYRSAVTYNLKGSSTITGSRSISSHEYHFKYWTPARSVVTLFNNMTEKIYWVYILQCNNQSHYTGYTDNLEKRFQEHLSGKGGKYTRSFKPLFIAQSWQINGDKAAAMRVERYIKKLTKTQKEQLILYPYSHTLINNLSHSL